jgi:hypothetical protein
MLRVGGVHQQHLDLTPERNPSGMRDPRVCLMIGRPPKTSPDDVDSISGEDRGEEDYIHYRKQLLCRVSQTLG